MTGYDVEIHPDTVQTVQTKSLWRRLFDFACGLPPDDTIVKHQESYEDRMKLLEEKPRWRRLANVNAIIALCLTMFLLGFYH